MHKPSIHSGGALRHRLAELRRRTVNSAMAALDKARRSGGWPNEGPRRPTVLLVAHQAKAPLFGAEHSFMDLARAVDQQRFRTICLLPAKNRHMQAALQPYCDKVMVRNYGWWRPHQPSPSSISAFRDIIRKEHVEIVHANTIMMFEALQAARQCGVIGILHARELIDRDEELRRGIGLEAKEIVQTLQATADHIVGNSCETRKLFGKGQQASVLYNAVDVERFDLPAPQAHPPLRVGMVSSNIPKKGLDDFVGVARLLHEAEVPVECVLIGPNNDPILRLKHQQRRGAAPANLRFKSYQSNPLDCYRSLDIVVNLSHVPESFGRTVAEAMACQRPVVGYRWGALPELVEHGSTGFLVERGDVAGVAQTLMMLTRQPQRIHQLGTQGRSRVQQRFSPSGMRDGIVALYQRLLERHSKESTQ